VNCLNAPYCEHRAECSPTVCDSFVPMPVVHHLLDAGRIEHEKATSKQAVSA
jgi:hypothetical protein